MTTLSRARFAVMRCFLQTVGRASDGLRIAFDEGFTSGTMLDYVYRNEPSGRFLIGRPIDRIYLSHPGWEVIRIRKANLERLLREALAAQRQLDREPMVLDVAAGPARYLLNVLAEETPATTRAVCFDQDEDALAIGRRHGEQRGLGDRVRFMTGDALSRESLAGVRPAANIVVASGFYDWMTDDSLVRRSMNLVHECLADGGCFLFTNQAGHVDLEMVQAVFRDFRGEPLRMVTRPATQVNGWAEAAGFEVLQTACDPAGHYSVTLAVKRGQAPHECDCR
ncbi:MAG: class I SAM-dependent methyltransferase family protein [Planctomycetes bacterium]|nr:class I SAM-dependent methyltransferase family protein [Planctomycetota bacterium]